jgi:hypothetical protein
MSVEEFQAPTGRVSVDGNVVGDELMDQSLWSLSLATVSQVASSDTFPSGDSCILCTTPGSSTGEGVTEQSTFKKLLNTVANDKIWHSLYLKGSGTVKLQITEINTNSVTQQTLISNVITLSNTWQRIDYASTATTTGYMFFSIITTTAQVATIKVNNVYINKGDTARSGANLAADAIKNTGKDGTTEGFEGITGSEVVSVDFAATSLKMSYAEA